MNKILRFSFIALLALVCGVVNAQEVTLDFTDNTVWNLPDGNKNGAKDAAEFSNGTYTITVAATSSYYWLSQNKALFYGKANATITLPKFDFDVERIDIVSPSGGSGKTTRNIFVGDEAVSTATTGANSTKTYDIAEDKQAANTIYTIKVTNANNDQIQKILIWKKGTSTPVETPKVDNIAAFKALTSGTKAILTLKDAKVQYVNGTSDMYIVDETGGIDIYNSSLTYTAGQILNGTIEATYEEFKKLPELTNITASELTATDGTVEPIEMTVEEAAKAENVCKLVKVKNITLVEVISGSYTNYYDSEDKTLQIYDKFKVGYTPNTKSAMNYTGILVPFNSQMELAPTVEPEVATKISSLSTDETVSDAPAYNIAGQKVSASYKGVVIKGGKKLIQK